MPRFRVRLTKTVEVMSTLAAADEATAAAVAKRAYPGYMTCEVKAFGETGVATDGPRSSRGAWPLLSTPTAFGDDGRD